ncbi:Zinc finger C-x8-C-x5-C-x3-H type family protein [Arabidopsis thaliana]|uniref:Zinc finger C-x8-C-x5-C-x3-H type family protein n=1 Tax=Arabidopsis thaliana TaxID=3702 RepID=A0A1P8AU48_ARATH|nr:Zinc finger C-x8-C-x5-C-x3-H type family protein [Arabidopsis thaliana]ANM60168.1 Zinc finger C-x8-C-x5-C-x3-H type family protein [Arabidopsis thaliana]|eukprot:NP_001322472.1 Zinc finger C-x8-C-x5-C-x3-H type family protein [Arabidopsis thaliana]
MRKELCRNFQRGSCRYGENCRFLHPQQAKPNNPFGFGTQNQQQQQQQQQQNSSNPFGFGVQSGGSSRPNQFQNTWSRTASTPTGGGAAASTQQTGKQTQPADHKCTDPAACKRVMQDDFKNERPMWKLTCYGHWKYFPCDVTGDISYEELRAVAYEEAKRGIPLQSIVERERNLQNSKIAEFENFLRNPYKGSVTANQSPFAATTPSIFPQSSQINSPSPAFSGFNQQTAFSNTNAGGLSSSGPPNAFASFNKQPNAFSVNTPQPVPSGPSGFQTNPSTTFKPASFGPGPGFATTPQNNNIFGQSTPTPATNTSQNNQTAFNFNVPVASFTAPAINTTNTSSGTELQIGGDPVDSSIWLKEKWNPGEIPEQAPPDAFV